MYTEPSLVHKSFLLGHLAACADGIVVLHVEHLVDHFAVVGVGHEASFSR